MLQDLMNAIARMEGFFNAGTTLAKRFNNPGNLMYAGQAGATGRDAKTGLAIFGTVDAGWAALERQIKLDASRGHDLASFFAKYAPAGHGDNNPAAYADFVANALNVGINTSLSAILNATPDPLAGSTCPAPASDPSASPAPKSPARRSPPSRSRRLASLGFFFLTISAASLRAQQLTDDTLTLQAPAPAAVSQVSGTVTGQAAGVRYVYWVIANYAGGSAQPTPVEVPNAPVSLDGSNYVTVRWSPVPGATSYDVLRTNTEAFAGVCTCAVATAVAGSSTDDQGGALSSYTFTPKPPAIGRIRISNSGATPAWVTDPSLGGIPDVETCDGGPMVAGSTVGQQCVDTTTTPRTLWEWDGAEWQAILATPDPSDPISMTGTYSPDPPTEPSTGQGRMAFVDDGFYYYPAGGSLQRTVVPSTCPVGQKVSAVNANGTITCEAVSSGGGLVLVEQQTASNSASLVFTSCISATYDEYAIEVVGLVPATDADIYLRFSTNGGSSYDSGNNYSQASIGWISTVNFMTGSISPSAPTAQIKLNGAANDMSESALWGLDASFRLYHPGSTTLYKKLIGSSYFFNDTNTNHNGAQTVAVYLSTSAANAFQIVASTGNLSSGVVRCYGLAK